MSRLFLIGGGGHARVLLDALRCRGLTVEALVDPDCSRGAALGLPYLPGGDDAELPRDALLVNGIGGAKGMADRRRVFEHYVTRGFRFAPVIHPSAIIAADVVLEEGVQVMAGAVVQTGTVLGRNCIVNTRAAIDHDGRIGGHAHVAPGVAMSGGVEVGECSLVGTGASIIPGIRIGREVVVGAGAAVTRNIPDGVRALGVPAQWR